MTKKQKDELNKAVLGEFFTAQEDEMRKGLRQMQQFVNIAVEEGFTRSEAIKMIIELAKP